MSRNSIKVLGICPDCSSEIRFRKAPHLGQLVTCHNCETNLEVVRRDPLELDWAFQDPFEDDDEDYDDLDWDDEDEYDDEDSDDSDDYDDWDDDEY
ncbi:MAG TPA: hypothetical protein VK879_20590 [Candidatus Sulfomarinibacteraceae bacterium]|nr:hypothetical protein [Candidatus Sulfomarinibacteraceae bacterium]